MKRALLDTNLYVDWMNTGLREELLIGPGYVRLLSSVVLMELRAGANTKKARSAVDRIARAYASGARITAPLSAIYGEAGDVLRALRRRGQEVRRASLVNDTLIALTARSQGATVYTTDAADFEAIREVRPFSLAMVS